MCTIFAYEGRKLGKDEIHSILKRTLMRGPDGERILKLENGSYMAFQRLSIMGLDERGMQPFERGGKHGVKFSGLSV